VKRTIVMALSVILALTVVVPMATAQEDLGARGANWWKWVLAKPTDQNPLNGNYTGGPRCDGQGEENGV
jgi:hypothetical protein